jgi:hypothetical protein
MMPLMSEARKNGFDKLTAGEFDLRPEDVPAFPPTDESGEVDISLIDTLLDMTPTERLQWHAEFSEFAEQQRQLRAKEYGFDPADIGPLEETE